MFRKILCIVLCLSMISAAGCSLSNSRINNRYTSTVEADSFYIDAQVSGQVTEIDVSQGDIVKEGQVIAKLDSKMYELQKKEAEGALKIAESKLEELPENVSDSLKKAAQGAVDQAQAALDLIQLQIDDTVIKAADGGIVTDVFLHKGEMCSQGMNIAKVSAQKNKFIRVYIEESKRNSVKIGDKLNLFDGDKYLGKADVIFISPESEFTPKNTETKSEKEKTLFEIKAELESNVNANTGMLIDAEVD